MSKLTIKERMMVAEFHLMLLRMKDREKIAYIMDELEIMMQECLASSKTSAIKLGKKEEEIIPSKIKITQEEVCSLCKTGAMNRSKRIYCPELKEEIGFQRFFEEKRPIRNKCITKERNEVEKEEDFNTDEIFKNKTLFEEDSRPVKLDNNMDEIKCELCLYCDQHPNDKLENKWKCTLTEFIYFLPTIPEKIPCNGRGFVKKTKDEKLRVFSCFHSDAVIREKFIADNMVLCQNFKLDRGCNECEHHIFFGEKGA